ncbi:uncharacterized protein KY384_000548 [Bacidia gigantensis]|uniref:uncharacterized protein n=1 Tax=Bacidia gigantensis TaxID=2732470 RepID=UPI001D043511|nr:uncharacterized protein KY384_000548 [Bacidia gigantensis]KAG8525788.1 hypothetical protein KY384_000548 [Bacidia gigantensis]
MSSEVFTFAVAQTIILVTDWERPTLPQTVTRQASKCSNGALFLKEIIETKGFPSPNDSSTRFAMAHQADAKRMLDDRGYVGRTIHDVNPAHLLEKAVRDRIVDSYYWKEQCFAINEASLCDRAADMSFFGGTYGQQKPAPFLCLILKLLQLQPERDIILEYLHQRDFKYLTALAAFYVRLTFAAKEVYTTLEPLLADYRKLRRRVRDGSYSLTYIDQFVDDLLTKDRVCATSLRKLPPRTILEDLDQLEPRESPLGEELDELDRDDDDEDITEVNGHGDHDSVHGRLEQSESP